MVKRACAQRESGHDQMAAPIQLSAMAVCHVSHVAAADDVAATPYPYGDPIAEGRVVVKATARPSKQHSFGLHRCARLDQIAAASHRLRCHGFGLWTLGEPFIDCCGEPRSGLKEDMIGVDRVPFLAVA
jgi:hypothetical protein